MQAIVSGREGNRIKIEVTIELSGSMLDMEASILRAVNAVGDAATVEALTRFDADGDPITMGGVIWYSKGQLPKDFNTPYGVVTVARHVYQRAEGGTTYCPMDDDARIIKKATPRFAMVVSHKFAYGGAARVQEDLEQNHLRPCLKATLQDLAAYVGTVVQAKEESWTYAPPALSSAVATVGIGVDGTCMLICDQKWREAMTGSLSLYDDKGERLHTIYVGAAPEYGKATFFERMERAIVRIKERYPTAHVVGIADGAKSNWDFLGPHIDEQVLDFYHATQYLGRAAAAIYPDDAERKAWLDGRCHDLKHEHRAAERILGELQHADSTTMTPSHREDLQDCITYFGNHLHQMHYAHYREKALRSDLGLRKPPAKPWLNNACVVPECAGPRRAPKSSSACALSPSPKTDGTSSGKRSISMAFRQLQNIKKWSHPS